LVVCFEYRTEHDFTDWIQFWVCVSHSDQCALKDRKLYTAGLLRYCRRKTLGPSLDDNIVCEDTVCEDTVCEDIVCEDIVCEDIVCEDTVPAVTLVCTQ